MRKAALVEDTILCMHGGLSPSLQSFEQVRSKQSLHSFQAYETEIDRIRQKRQRVLKEVRKCTTYCSATDRRTYTC